MCMMRGIMILVHMHILYTNLFISYGENRVCHNRPVQAIETGQRSMCCQIPTKVDATLLLVAPPNLV